MLFKLSRLKNLGVFSDYAWDAQLPAFERYNVIYGENGTGKTTLSRLLDCLGSGTHTEYPGLEYKIESGSGDLVHGKAGARRIRVFNADYVNLNIGQLDGNLKHILVIGEENKAVAETIVAQEAELSKREAAERAANARIEDLQKARGKIFTEIAKTISEAISGNTARTYRKNNAEAAFAQLADDSDLDQRALDAHRATIRQEIMDKIEWEEPFHTQIGDDEVPLRSVGEQISTQVTALCARTAASEAISRLAANPDIATWVEQGVALHHAHGSTECEFCGAPLQKQRWKELETHFSAADQALKDDIQNYIDLIANEMSNLTAIELPDRNAFYSELREDVDHAKVAIDAACKTVMYGINKSHAALSSKQISRSAVIDFKEPLDFGPVADALEAFGGLVALHNDKTASFDEAKQAAQQAIELHYLRSVKSDVAEYDQKIAEQEEAAKDATDGSPEAGELSMQALNVSIKEKKAQISNAHKAAETLTKHLQTFLGRSELVFESRDDGYRICRNGKVARRLSEGERTAIAFIYFIVHLTDRDFDKAEGIIVIDDPVSSLDASSVYQAFAFLKDAVQDAKQVFLLTHNFSFLRLVINWFENIKKAEGKKQFYMLVCKAEQDGRRSSIKALDRALIDHPTEYHFLFKTLANFKSDGTIGNCYHIPNVTRKVLETFLDFYVPERKTTYAKLNDLPFDKQKKTAIYKFANDLSHFTGQGFEPGLVQESQNNATYLLELIEALAPQHYAGMMAAIK